MASSTSAVTHSDEDTSRPPADGLGGPAVVPRGGRRDRIRSKPGLGQAYRLAVFLAGLLCIVLGVALAVLPGPLTIPPILLGLWIWSTEFRFAQRFLDRFKARACDAWAHAKRHPRSSALVTAGGLLGAGVALWAVVRFELVDQARNAAGI